MDLKELNELRDQYYTAVKESGSDAIFQECQKYLEENPEVQAVGWYQYYTPTPNGKTLRNLFVRDLHETKKEDFDPSEKLNTWDLCGDSDLLNMVESNEDLLEEVFGDNKQIVITRGGMEVSEYWWGSWKL